MKATAKKQIKPTTTETYLKDHTAVDGLKGLQSENFQPLVAEHLVDDFLCNFLVHVVRGAGVEISNPMYYNLKHQDDDPVQRPVSNLS